MGLPVKTQYLACFVTIALATGLARAGVATVQTSADANVNNGAAANYTRAYGGAFTLNINPTTSTWFKFSAADFPADLRGATINSVSIQYVTALGDSTTALKVFFNSNAGWQEYPNPTPGANGFIVVDPATTPYLCYDDSGLPGAANSRFQSSAVLVASPASVGGAANATQTVPLALAHELVSALSDGADFSLFGTTTGGRLALFSTEAEAAGSAPQARALNLVVDYTAAVVPEPAALAPVTALASCALLRRRRKI